MAVGLPDNSCKLEEYDNFREDLVNTAVKFLQNPKVVNTPLVQKQTFLQRKGLTDKEVQIACERSGAYNYHNVATGNALAPNVYHAHQQVLTYFDWFKRIVHGTTIISALIYGAYILYKKVIQPLLFNKKELSLDEKLELLSKNLQQSIEEQLNEVKDDLDRSIQQRTGATHRQIQDVKSEITSLKGLMLNRKQFPSVSVPVVPPSIPAWQLSSLPSESVEGEGDNKSESEQLMELGSGSGGSSDQEHEPCTTKSDSSIEIM